MSALLSSSKLKATRLAMETDELGLFARGTEGLTLGARKASLEESVDASLAANDGGFGSSKSSWISRFVNKFVTAETLEVAKAERSKTLGVEL